MILPHAEAVFYFLINRIVGIIGTDVGIGETNQNF